LLDAFKIAGAAGAQISDPDNLARMVEEILGPT